MITSPWHLDLMRECSKDEAAFERLLALFEDQYRNLEARYSPLARHFPNGVVFLFDRDLRFVLAEGQGLASIGLSRTLSEGKLISAVLPLEDAHVIESMVRRTLNGESINKEVPFAGRVYQAHTVPLRNPGGEVHMAMTMLQDIAERKQTETALRAQQHFIEQVIRAIPDIVYVYDLVEQRNAYVNRELTEKLGYTADEIRQMGSNVLTVLLHPDDLPYVREKAKAYATLRDDEVLEIEYRIRHADGSWRWLYSREVIFRRGADGMPQQVFGVAQDITERKRTAEQLRLITDNMHDLVSQVDVNGVFQYVGPSHFKVLGYAPESLIGEFSGKLIHPDDRDVVASMFREALKTGKAPSSIQFRARRADGEYVWLESTVSLLFNEQGKADGAVFSSRDIAKRKEAEAQALELAVEREKMQVLESFIQDTSHDFKTPLTSLKSSIYLLHRLHERLLSELAKLKTSTTNAGSEIHLVWNNVTQTIAEINERIRTQENSSQRLERLVDSLLEIARLDKHLDFDFAPHNLNRLVDTMISMYSALADERGLSISFEPDATLERVWLDEATMSRVIQNLLENAIQYTPAGGTITVRTHRDAQQAVLTVSDTGVGINETDLPLIFERFYRSDRARATSTGGAGLGLAISRKIVETHQGRIEVTSTPGVGSTFSVILPLQPDLAR